MKVVYVTRKSAVNFIFQLIVNFITLCATYGQIQMELSDQNGMNSGLGYPNVLPGDSVQVAQMGPSALNSASDSSQISTPLQSTETVSTENVGSGDLAVGAQASNIQPASSVVGIFPSYRPQYGFPGYLPSVFPGKGVAPGINTPPDNIVVASFPGSTPSVTQPSNALLSGGVLTMASGVKPGSSVSPTATLTQQTVQSVLSYLSLHHPEIFHKYLYPKPYQKPYDGSYVRRWLREIPPSYKYGDDGVIQPYGDVYQPDPYDYYDPVDLDPHYWPRRRKPLGVLKRRRRYNLYKRFN
ncbi:unnamed protein product [Schistosoma rodhaini]|uniref:Uncharacterized protein n=1 Tax=Schistosoma rodhaini TaxID=6188 RepID=A0AA85FGQ7_9TREM|nr:unnamed protein product [Schistosoma rodhaini]